MNKVVKKRRLKKWVKFVILLLILVIIYLFANLFLRVMNKDKTTYKHDSKVKTTIKTTKEEKNEFSMVMVGDCLIHRFVYEDASLGNNTYSFDKMFTEVEPLIKNHDLAYYNQESTIGGKALGLSAYPRFNSPEEIGDSLKTKNKFIL